MLIAERLRRTEEKREIQTILETHMKIKLDVAALYYRIYTQGFSSLNSGSGSGKSRLSSLVWTPLMVRMFALVWRYAHCNSPLINHKRWLESRH